MWTTFTETFSHLFDDQQDLRDYLNAIFSKPVAENTSKPSQITATKRYYIYNTILIPSKKGTLDRG